MNNLLNNRYEFVYLYDVENGNPNGDPDAENMPRTDPETGFGIVTDVCLKRKIRNFVQIVKDDAPPYCIYVKDKAVLSNQQKKAYKALEIDTNRKSADHIGIARQWMCQNFYDIRTFGAVMSFKDFNCGQVRGPVQLNFGRSIDPIFPRVLTITRMAVATEKESIIQAGVNQTIGHKSIVPYALYRTEGYISAHLAQQTGFNEADLELLWNSLMNMFDHDRSASHGKMCARMLIIFKHNSKLGNAPAHKLFETVTISPCTDKPPRSFYDYKNIIQIPPEGHLKEFPGISVRHCI